MSGIGVVNQYGVLMVRPGVSIYSEASDTKPAVGRLVKEMLVIGPSNRGDPNKLYRFSSLNQAKQMIGDGPVLEAVTDEALIDPIRLMELMQRPSKSPEVSGAHTINFLRVGEPTRANWTFDNATSDNVLDIWSTDYGLEPNNIRIRFEKGMFVPEGSTVYVKDEKISRNYANLGRAIYVMYSGNAAECELTISVNDSDEAIRLLIEVTTGAETTTHVDLDLTRYATIGSVVSALNGYEDITASVSPYADPKLPASVLDPVTKVGIKKKDKLKVDTVTTNTIKLDGTPNFTANELAGRLVEVNSTDGTKIRPRVVSNSEDTLTFDGIWDLTYYTAANKGVEILDYTANAIIGSICWTLNRQESSRLYAQKMSTAIGTHYDKPRDVPYTSPTTFGRYLSADTASGHTGRTDKLTNTDWVNALEKAEKLFRKSGAIIALTHSESIGLLFDAYARKQREYYARDLHNFAPCGDADTNPEEACAIARDYNSIDSTPVCNCPELFNSDGKLEFTTPLYGAAMCAGMYVGSGVKKPLTGNVLACQGLKYRWGDDEETALIESGATVLTYDEDTIEGSSSIRVLLALTSWTGDAKSIWRRLYGKTVVGYINQLLKRECWPLFYGKRITVDVGQSIQNRAKTVLESLSYPTEDQLLMADPRDPVNKPAYTMPRFSMTGDGAGYLEWSGNIVDEGNYLLITGTVAFQSPTFE